MTDKQYAGRKGPWFASPSFSMGPRCWSIHDKVRGALSIAIVGNHKDQLEAHAALLRTAPQMLELLQEVIATPDVPHQLRERAAAVVERALDIEVR